MMMSRNSVTSYFGKRLKGWYSVHSHWHKSGGNFTKVIELHKTKISEGGIRPKKDLSKQWKGRRCHLSPAPSIWDEGSPDQLCLRRAQPRGDRSSPPVTYPAAALLGAKKAGGGIRDTPSRWGHAKGSHREDQVLEFYCDANSPRSIPGQGTGLPWASLPSQRADTGVAVNILELWLLFDTFPISLTNTAALSRGASAASGVGS